MGLEVSDGGDISSVRKSEVEAKWMAISSDVDRLNVRICEVGKSS